ncbi:MAG: hypothetical protein EP330_22635 [Deltaproteobacteria bacterium]|nr:MAG: hypothetical protein EP330_22635 [Deltaproteobacteria bacterium]
MVVHHRRAVTLLALALAACTGSGEDSGWCTTDASFELQPYSPVGNTVPFALAGEDCGEHLWDFGDGTQSEEATPRHRYERPGHFQVVHRETFADGSSATASALILVFRESEGTPLGSSTLQPIGLGGYFAVLPDYGVVRVGSDQGFAAYTGCESPRTATPTWLSGAFVACEGEDVVVELNSELEEIRRIELGAGSRPYGVVVSPDTGLLVSLAGTGELVTVSSDAVVARTAVSDPRGVAVGPTGQIAVSRFRSPDGHGEIAVPGGEPWTLAFADQVDSDNTSRGVPNLLEHMVFSPDGGTLYVAGQVSNTARGEWRDGQALTHETTVRAVLRGIDTTTGEEIRALDRQFDNHGRAGPIALSPRGDWLWVAFPDTSAVFKLDAYTGRTVDSIPDVGRGITGLVATGDTLAVHAWLDRVVRVYDTDTVELIAEYPTVDVEPLDPQVLRGKQLFHDALDRRITKDGYISCVSCHPDGDQDGLVWDFTDRGEGLRNTSSLLGRAGTGMGRLHWSGNFDEVQDFEHDIRGPFAGNGLLAETDWLATNDTLGTPKAGLSADLDALAAYVTSLDEVPASPHAYDADGEALFADLGCDTCHPAPLYTDSSLADLRHDVGTLTPASGGRLGGALDGLDTPTLLGVHATGPWLHDGSAATLEEAVLAHDTLPRTPDASELASLVAFLASL